MEVADSARRHGVADDDISHAVRNGLRHIARSEAMTLVIGPDRAGRLLEIVVIEDDGGLVAIHAMPLRPKFFDYLR